jgi:hypothetical protein
LDHFEKPVPTLWYNLHMLINIPQHDYIKRRKIASAKA